MASSFSYPMNLFQEEKDTKRLTDIIYASYIQSTDVCTHSSLLALMRLSN